MIDKLLFLPTQLSIGVIEQRAVKATVLVLSKPAYAFDGISW